MIQALLNGVLTWDPRPNWHMDTFTSTTFAIPPNRTSTVMFTIPAGVPNSGMRSHCFIFYGNTMLLPNGLEYVDDLQTATGNFTT